MGIEELGLLSAIVFVAAIAVGLFGKPPPFSDPELGNIEWDPAGSNDWNWNRWIVRGLGPSHPNAWLGFKPYPPRSPWRGPRDEYVLAARRALRELPDLIRAAIDHVEEDAHLIVPKLDTKSLSLSHVWITSPTCIFLSFDLPERGLSEAVLVEFFDNWRPVTFDISSEVGKWEWEEEEEEG